MVFYNAFSKYEIRQGWASGSHQYPYNAIDFATPIGFKFGAPADGVWVRCTPNHSRTDRTAAGNYGYLLLEDGSRLYFCHLDRHIAGHQEKVKQGDILAATGNTGFVRPTPTESNPAAGAHVHTYGKYPNGTRFDWTVNAVTKLPTPAAAKPGYPHKKVTLAAVNLRKSPKTGAIIRVIPAGTVIKTGSTSKGWTPVKVGRVEGWIAAEFAVITVRKVAKQGLILRDRPTAFKKGAKVKARLKKGSKVTVLAVNGKDSSATYWKVRAGLRTGWVHSEYLK